MNTAPKILLLAITIFTSACSSQVNKNTEYDQAKGVICTNNDYADINDKEIKPLIREQGAGGTGM